MTEQGIIRRKPDRQEKLTCVVYTPDKGMAHSGTFFLELIKDLFTKQTRELAWRLMLRNISAKYRQSMLGVLWIFLPALMNALIWVFLNRANIINIEEPSVPYPFFVICGTVLWQFFATSIAEPITAVKREKALLTKVNIPREALLLAGFGELIITSFTQLLILIPIFLWFNITPSWEGFLVPAGVMMILCFGFSLGLILIPIGLLYDDVAKTIPMLTRVWFFLTPVVYPMPENTFMATLLKLNPVTSLIVTTRDWITGQPTSELVALMWVSAGTTTILFTGIVIYRLTMPIIIERMSA
jgi:lipopolysaccharide transport system permease protein